MDGMTHPITHLTTQELAERWKMSVNTLEHWRYVRKGPRWIRFGLRKVLYPIAEVEAYEKACLFGKGEG